MKHRTISPGLMTEREATREYLDTLKHVYKEKGFLSAVGYEVSSTFYSLGKRIANLFDVPMPSPVSPMEHETAVQYHDRVGKTLRRDEDRENARQARISDRKVDRKEFILRGKKSPLENVAATASILTLAGSILVASFGITGFVVSNSTMNSSFFPVGLFLLGLVFGMVYFNSKFQRLTN